MMAGPKPAFVLLENKGRFEVFCSFVGTSSGTCVNASEGAFATQRDHCRGQQRDIVKDARQYIAPRPCWNLSNKLRIATTAAAEASCPH